MLICFVLLSFLPSFFFPNFFCFPSLSFATPTSHTLLFLFEHYLHISLQLSLRSHLRVTFWAGTGPRGSLEETGLLCLVHDKRITNYDMNCANPVCFLNVGAVTGINA